MSSSPGSPPADHIWLFLESHPADPEALYLEIPLEPPLPDESQLEDGGIYTFNTTKVMTPAECAERRADVEVVKQRSQFGGSEVRLSSFDDGVYARDAVPFSKPPQAWSQKRFTSWLTQEVLRMRSDFEEGEDMDEIDDCRNGFCGEKNLHPVFDGNWCALVKVTPNRILDMDDIPAASDRPLDVGSSYPTDARYTLQFLDQSYERASSPNNTDGAFLTNHDPATRPSMFLFHYRYGASALVRWGRGLEKRIPPSRPLKTIAVAAGQSDTTDPKQRNLKKDAGMQGMPQSNASWTTQDVFEVYDPLDVVKMISPWYDPQVDEAYDRDVEGCLHHGGFSDEVEKWRNAVP
ncbi:hypothetical protein BT96DRAFT_972143 [Gymnopus androsaceus JB14]|uniref:HNH nuclease domain-containing protein n=1 Tax=Gymnopus androsaceus JB14 TaxID=1447944 RepID=A0A6A4IAR2_9AGAR|nr:hypothetical protein BT96DRAFT_972143 [Gymnopus androsaceus JB14]